MSPAPYVGPTFPARAQYWSAKGIVSTPSMSKWPLRIISMSSMPARMFPADRNELKPSIGRVMRLAVTRKSTFSGLCLMRQNPTKR